MTVGLQTAVLEWCSNGCPWRPPRYGVGEGSAVMEGVAEGAADGVMSV